MAGKPKDFFESEPTIGHHPESLHIVMTYFQFNVIILDLPSSDFPRIICLLLLMK
jgi:hypothetical protein